MKTNLAHKHKQAPKRAIILTLPRAAPEDAYEGIVNSARDEQTATDLLKALFTKEGECVVLK